MKNKFRYVLLIFMFFSAVGISFVSAQGNNTSGNGNTSSGYLNNIPTTINLSSSINESNHLNHTNSTNITAVNFTNSSSLQQYQISINNSEPLVGNISYNLTQNLTINITQNITVNHSVQSPVQREIMIGVQQREREKQNIHTDQYELRDRKQGRDIAQAHNNAQLKFRSYDVKSSLEIKQEQTPVGNKIHAKLSNGRNSEIKIMPETASERAIERLMIKKCIPEEGCEIELKEVGKGEKARAAYEINARKESKLLGIFNTRMKVSAHVDAENGEIIQSSRPWWAFLAT